MNSTTGLGLAKKWFEQLWSGPALEIADEIVDPDYDPDWIHIDAVGPAQVKHEVTYFRLVFPNLEYQIVDIAPSEDRVWVRYRATGNHEGNAWGFSPTYKDVEFQGVTILYFNPEGKIVDRWGAFCFYDILTELELVPPFWELSDYFSKTQKE